MAIEHHRTPAASDAVTLIETTIKAAAAYEREDLVGRLRLTRERVIDPAVSVLVVGEFKQGKSSLVNSMIRAHMCPVDDDIATATPMVLRHGAESTATLVYPPPDPTGINTERRRRRIEVADLPRFVADGGVTGEDRPEMVEVTLPSKILEDGLVLVDTPGVGGLGSPYTAVTMATLPLADALIFVTDASQELTKPEIDFLTMARSMCPNLIVALTKRDLYPRWREMAERDREILAALEVPSLILSVSPPLHSRGVELGDSTLVDESGIEILERNVARSLVVRAQQAMRGAVAADLLSVIGQLEARFRTEREVLADPAAGEALAARLEHATARANELRSNASKWQHTLQDGIADLTADIDTDLRGGMRILTREAEEAIDGMDPAEVWEEFETWLRTRTMHLVAGVYARMHQRSEELSRQVAEHFRSGEDEFQRLLLGHPQPGSLEVVDLDATTQDKGWGSVEKGLFAMRSSYGGILMFGMVSGFVGLSMVNPASLVIGVLMGRKALKDERKRRLTQRQNQAKTAARRYLDDVQFQASTETRAALRRVQRELRDWYGARAEEHQRLSQEALTGIQEARKKDNAERQSRLRDIDAEIQRLDALRRRVENYRGQIMGERGAA